MTPQRSMRWRGPLAAGLALSLLAAACADGDDDDDASSDSGSGDSSENLEGTTVTLFGPEVEGELQGLQDSFKDFEEETGITIEVSGDRSFEEQIGNQVDG